MKKRLFMLIVVCIILILPGFVLCPVELVFIILKNVWEQFVAWADGPRKPYETPEAAALKCIGLAAAITAVKVTCELYYIYFGVDLYTLTKEGLLTPEDLENRGDEEIVAYVVRVREARFNELGTLPWVFFVILQKSAWENPELIRQIVEDYYREDKSRRG